MEMGMELEREMAMEMEMERGDGRWEMGMDPLAATSASPVG